jgi:periplasmic divalent cation tolerance protein
VAECVHVSTTLPDETTARQFGRRLVEERLAACAQIAGPIWSTYWWRGEVQEAGEWYCHLKTTADASAELTGRIRELHPYEVPEIIVLAIKEGNPSYLKWIGDTVRQSPKVPVP